ncbi:acrylyl-CoA reductase (NADPH) [Bisgaardia hudsonensis]|uniref:Acrylyl-CoA reductase (NADPH) n=1 Tax=Bisgaardia hudsonensis TaxID=109472 RepID=A0A4R2N1A0_9PAST|nr:MDR family oxidoreductase [Bisgaardia hudsonensis]QLB13096.1 alcohol dehydrogenase [Bisgaardia hudsonensis]TCP13337.1 acrylyl-CoA reductase (NADPH) [Bisgaardia hudsonensis]
MFKGIIINNLDNDYETKLENINEKDLPEGDVLVKVYYSTINYKDALAITGKAPIVRKFPMIPGIDFAGSVLETNNKNFNIGDKVILNGWGVGEKHWGGLAEKARVKSDWLIPLPQNMTFKQAMSIGTAGYTAMLAVLALQKENIIPDSGKILVTGASGGVGSFAINILSKLGYDVIASTGRLENSNYLTALGANEIIDRNTLSEKGKPLMKERWVAAIDSLGGSTLANVCASTSYGGMVIACGLAQAMDFPATVAPFILRGITLKGIDSVMASHAFRIEAWNKLSQLIKENELAPMIEEISLNDVIIKANNLIKGNITGRIIVKLN